MTCDRAEKKHERTRITDEMDRLARELIAMRMADPDNFDAREPLWMKREALRAQLEAT